MSLGKFVTKLYDEVMSHHGEVRNFASLLRCCCLIHASRTVVAPGETSMFADSFLTAAE